MSGSSPLPGLCFWGNSWHLETKKRPHETALGLRRFGVVAALPSTIGLPLRGPLLPRALLAKRADRLSLGAEEMATAVLEGYTNSLNAGGAAVLSFLKRSIPVCAPWRWPPSVIHLRFWSKLSKLPKHQTTEISYATARAVFARGIRGPDLRASDCRRGEPWATRLCGNRSLQSRFCSPRGKS